MTIGLSDEEIAYVTIEIKNPEKFQEFMSILEEPAIKNIYSQRLSTVFGEVKNLRIYAKAQSILIEFESKLAKQKEEKWIVGRKEFRRNIDNISTLKIVLPENAKLLDSNPEPNSISGSVLIWNNVDFIPEIRYERSSTSYKLLLVVILLGLLAFVFKKTKQRLSSS